MDRRLTAVFSLLFIFISSYSQELSDKVLMNVGGKDITAGEFIRMYRKSSAPGNSGDLDSYLDQFISFKLKVADAEHSGYDTTLAFKKELAGYRTQLAKSYLTDPETKENLLKQAFQRSLVEVNTWHILVSLPPEAAPADTLKAWKKAVGIRERIKQGETFEQVARSSSDDPSVKFNGGNLGYFTAFQMIMPFEDAAYRMKKGDISSPVRTPYGYHVILLADRRPSSGKIRVAHIMITVPAGASDKVAEAAKDTIWAVYRKLLAGASFPEMAAKYSQHKESASKGGELNWFGAGEVVSDFAEAAFRLKKNGDISIPVKTLYGWHIIKRIDRRPPGTYEELRPWLESKINESYLYSISRKSFIEKLKKSYRYSTNSQSVNWFVENTDSLIIKGQAKYNRLKLPKGWVFKFADQLYSSAELAAYIEKSGSMISASDPDLFISRAIESAVADRIIAYENSVLEKKYPEFRYLMNEFHDGILLFDISGKKVWNKSQDDSTGLKNYYAEHKSEHLSLPGCKGKIYSLRQKGGMKALSSAYNRNKALPDCDKRMITKFTVKKDTLLTIRESEWRKGDDHVIDSLKWEKGIYETVSGGYPALVILTDVIAPVPLPLNQVRGEMIAGYQDYLEKTWLAQLKERYSVKTDRTVFEEIRKKMSNE
jgi:peptidyl-prolyl cis-trans isomerase SurA